MQSTKKGGEFETWFKNSLKNIIRSTDPLSTTHNQVTFIHLLLKETKDSPSGEVKTEKLWTQGH